MIYTLTLNPALDYILKVDSLDIGQTNRSDYEIINAGGKGINVSKIFKNLSEDSIALGFVAGFSGDELLKILEKEEINSDFIRLDSGFTRINVKIKSDKETEINGKGPNIDKKKQKDLFSKLEKLEDNDYLFLSGNLPSSLGSDFYRKIILSLKDKNINIIVDATGDALKETLDLSPFLIKPNLRELEELFHITIENKEDIRNYARKLQDMKARNIIVSLGKDGAYLLSENKEEMFLSAPKGEVVNSVGAGDSMVAGFVYAKKNGKSDEEAFRFSLACGSATAFSSDIAKKEEIFDIYKKIGGENENN